MFAVRGAEEIFTFAMFIPVFKKWENLVSNRNNTDSGCGFRLDDIEIAFLKVDMFFL